MNRDVIGLAAIGSNRQERERFRVRADAFSSAHGRPNGMPGRGVGARAKTLPRGGAGAARNEGAHRGSQI
jgi:hypothetical protein